MDCALNTKEMTNNQKSKSQQGHKAAFSRRPSFDHLDAGYESHYSLDKGTQVSQALKLSSWIRRK